MIFGTIVTKPELVQIFLDRGIASESTVHKLASGNCPGKGFEGFPASRQLGATRAWRLEELESWIEGRFSEKENLQPKQTVHPGAGRGRPTRREKIAAQESGLSVKAWRQREFEASGEVQA